MTFRGPAYRAHDPRWAWTPLSGEGARLRGGRFNRIGTAALYLALEYKTAILEAKQGFEKRIPPLTIVEYEVDVDPVADLTDPQMLRSFGQPDLDCAWKRLAEAGQPVPTWALADEIVRNGFAGLIIPSFAVGADPTDKNLILWRWGDQLPTKVTVFDPEQRLQPMI